MYSVVDYVPPKWCESRIKSEYIPKAKVNLGLLPTPLHQCKQIPKMVSNNIEFYFKRDDLTSFDMSGNKIRKLEFLLGHALKNKHDCVLTIGGLQSNHARATAIASRQLGLEPYLVLRTDGYSAEEAASNDLNIGVPGNLLLDRMVNSQIYTVSTDDYVSIGGLNILNKLGSQLREEGRNPYIIPVGGSNMLGTWGYMQAVDELNQQLCQLSSHDIANSTEMTTYHIVFASGSGGTACGLVLGCYLAGLTLNSPYREANCRLVVKLHGICVCDAPDDFYDHINKEAHTMLEQAAGSTNPIFESREQCTFYQGMGIGYGLMTNDELLYLMQECITPSGKNKSTCLV